EHVVGSVLPELATAINRVATEDGISAARVPVDLAGDVINRGRLRLAELKRRHTRSDVRTIRHGIELEVGNGRRVHRDLLAVDHPVACVLIGNGRELGDAEPLPQALIVAEEEESVALDGTAGGGAELVADKQGNRLVRVIEEVLGIECRIAQKFVYVPVQRVGTRFADPLKDAPLGAPDSAPGVVGNAWHSANILNPGLLPTGAPRREVLAA